ncbi:MAG: MBL fold metallo-hydrolase, partial [Clostridiales bacterium]
MNLQFSPLLSSSSGNTSLISAGRTAILVDAGATGSAIEKALRETGQHAGALAGILITHEHIDHIKGAGVLSRKYNLPIY